MCWLMGGLAIVCGNRNKSFYIAYCPWWTDLQLRRMILAMFISAPFSMTVKDGPRIKQAPIQYRP